LKRKDDNDNRLKKDEVMIDSKAVELYLMAASEWTSSVPLLEEAFSSSLVRLTRAARSRVAKRVIHYCGPEAVKINRFAQGKPHGLSFNSG
jgi:hypothetical protein